MNKIKFNEGDEYIILRTERGGFTAMVDCTEITMVKLLLTFLDSNKEYENIFKKVLDIYDKRAIK